MLVLLGEFTVNFTVNNMGTPALEQCDASVMDADPRLALTCRVTESVTFQKSLRLREFLLYVCQKTIENRTDEIREQMVGHRVFGRRPDYNPSEDNIVRVEARQLRKRLDSYFLTEGAGESIVITIPKGSYVPRFDPRPLVEPDAPLALPTSQEDRFAIVTPARTEPMRRRSAVVVVAITGVLAVIVFACGIIAGRYWPASPTTHVPKADPRTALWSSLFNEETQTYIVCADSSWVLRQDILDRKLGLSEYISTNWNAPPSEAPGAKISPVLRFLQLKQYTSVADVRLVEHLAVMNAAHWKRTAVLSSRFVQMQEFKNSNMILIGSSRSTPWVEMFEPQLNFAVEYDYRLHIPIVRNKHPKPGELPVYQNGLEGGKPSHVFSTISYLPNLTHNGHILLIQGSSSEGSEAAGEWVTSPAALAMLLQKLKLNPSSSPDNLEVLLRSRTMGGTPGSTEVVAYRMANRMG